MILVIFLSSTPGYFYIAILLYRAAVFLFMNSSRCHFGPPEFGHYFSGWIHPSLDLFVRDPALPLRMIRFST